jgi:hypothetical protein
VVAGVAHEPVDLDLLMADAALEGVGSALLCLKPPVVSPQRVDLVLLPLRLGEEEHGQLLYW